MLEKVCFLLKLLHDMTSVCIVDMEKKSKNEIQHFKDDLYKAQKLYFMNFQASRLG